MYVRFHYPPSLIKGSTALGVFSILGGGIDGWLPKPAFAEDQVDIAAVTGMDYFKNTIKAVELLGGMGKFVPGQATVGLLVNSPWDNPGSYVRPDIVLAVLRMCREAGAKEIGVFKDLGRGYWKRSALADSFRDEIQSITSLGGDYMEVTIPKGRSLKNADVARALLDCDVFINIPIAKDHTGLGFTGTMKNMMGLTSSTTTNIRHCQAFCRYQIHRPYPAGGSAFNGRPQAGTHGGGTSGAAHRYRDRAGS